MASVTLRTLWLNDADDLSDSMSFPWMSKLSVQTAKPGEVRLMSNGRLRVVTRAGQTRTFDVDLPNLTRVEVEWLEAHIGRTLLVRDDRGRKIYGAFFTLPDDAHQYDDENDVQLTLQEITRSEAV